MTAAMMTPAKAPMTPPMITPTFSCDVAVLDGLELDRQEVVDPELM